MDSFFAKKRLKLALKKNFTPPPTRQMEHFINNISYPKAKFSELLISQIGFIRKRVWFLFALSVCFAFSYAQLGSVPENIVSSISAILPLVSLGTIIEIYKSCAFCMEETELACKHNLSKITLMRLCILGTISFATLLLLVAFAGKSDFGTLRNTVYIAVPYLLSSYVSLLIITKFRTKDTIYVCAAASIAVGIFILIARNSYVYIYNIDFAHFWIVAFLALTGLFIFSLIRFVKSQEELQWNLL